MLLNVFSTKLVNGNGVSVSTVKHLMAAFMVRVDNVLVEVNAPEIPIMDGSAVDFVDAIRSVGVEEQNDQENLLSIKKVEVVDGKIYFNRTSSQDF